MYISIPVIAFFLVKNATENKTLNYYKQLGHVFVTYIYLINQESK